MNRQLLSFQENDLSRLGLKRAPANWENGLREDPRRRTLERWTAETLFGDGGRIAVSFSTRRQLFTLLPPNPTVSIDVLLPDGTELHHRFSEGSGKLLTASAEYCDLNVSGSYLRFHDGVYTLYFVDEQLEYRAVFKPLLDMWRPGTGLLSPDGGRHSFGWLTAVPRAAVEATFRWPGGSIRLDGTGCIDHMWGDGDLGGFFDHWYLCRAFTGRYTAICTDLLLRGDDPEGRLSLFYLARDGEVLLDGSLEPEVSRQETFLHPATRRFYDGRITFSAIGEDGTGYSLVHSWQRDFYAPTKPGVLAKLLDRFGLNRTTLVSVSDAVLRITEGETVTEAEGLGMMEQISCTPLPQAKPDELLGDQWPPEGFYSEVQAADEADEDEALHEEAASAAEAPPAASTPAADQVSG